MNSEYGLPEGNRIVYVKNLREEMLREDAQAVYAQNLESEINRVGRGKFRDVFLSLLSGEEYILNPEEVFIGDQNGFMEVYHQELKTFHLKMYERYLHIADPALVARNISHLGEEDIPKTQLLENLRSQ